MKQFLKISLLAITIFFISCDKNSPLETNTTTNDDLNFFIWQGLNLYYLWQKDVPDLADDRFYNYDDLYTYFGEYDSPEAVFESLLNRPDDRFSIIVDDYIALENSFQGLNLSNGMEFGLVTYKNGSNNVYGYVRYVIPNSSAESENVTRGMIFNTVDGSQITINNYLELLFSSTTNYTIGLADFNDGNPIENGTSISLDKTELQENPIATSKVITEGSQKIGYLMYNQFARNYDSQLNTAFANFKAENINDLIVDLRYNPGGSVSTATYLGSMITGQFTGELYSQEIWNDKVTAAWPSETFVNNFTDQIRNVDTDGSIILEETINSLGLERIYFIVSYGSASASELVINALSSHIQVNLIGETTRGKQQGSITIYDSDNLQRTGDNLNPNHTYAMQPLVLEISNKEGINYPEGIIPDTANFPGIFLEEDYGNLGVLGERSDPLLDRTLTYISTGLKSSVKTSKTLNFNEIYDSKLAIPASDYMFVDIK
ncbi:peptidase S41 [Polaribacter vadi]|uniref:S41 family peptidase n=1 Tax=Polaribacter TaxID=52959 RepID=UPI001C098219|nr:MULTISPECIES: S41 family peptidase [Polaribacter]MBU3012393.1 peptidase S41 [Polaribacter vadi]MDO6742210.1 S41 family peptidase [Polaribacter sp. 1_MG-2023]